MNRFLAILLCLCLSCQCVLKLSIYTWFELNREYIAASLCENKARPELVCCGKCVLTKKLAIADGLEHNNPKQQPVKIDKTEITAFILPEIINTVAVAPQTETTAQNGYPDPFREQTYEPKIFHPPAV